MVSTTRDAALFFDEGDTTDFGDRVGIALFPLVGLDVARSDPMAKTETLPAADNENNRRSKGWSDGEEERWIERASESRGMVAIILPSVVVAGGTSHTFTKRSADADERKCDLSSHRKSLMGDACPVNFASVLGF